MSVNEIHPWSLKSFHNGSALDHRWMISVFLCLGDWKYQSVVNLLKVLQDADEGVIASLRSVISPYLSNICLEISLMNGIN